ncbi:MAG: dTDP-4-dehydrorhamnose 3,5-epimerase [Bacteroidales bacterium]|nr:dTDP-4-dehydrorhamnose 3,5-epimerase [Bacteroidales bacterium]MDY6347762.1 dTDP-4-dehydrorhamnose 3,5-epimerase [Bacteroidales bacterium]
MKIIKTEIEGLLIIDPVVFRDDRGYFFESYNIEKMRAAGIEIDFVQDNQSSSMKDVVRGLHFQTPPFAQAKLVRVVKGSVVDVAVDIRKNSPTYGKHVSVLLSADNFRQFYLPEGFAHGFVALEDDTVFSYKCSALYNKESERCIVFNDPDLGIEWNVENPVVSEKDLQGERFAGFSSPFTYNS